MPADEDAIRVAAEVWRVAVHPQQRTANLVRLHLDAPVDVLSACEVEHHKVRTGHDEEFSREGEVTCRSPIEGATMQQDLHRSSGDARHVEVHRFSVRRSVGQSPWRAKPSAHGVAVEGETTYQLRQVGGSLEHVKGVVQLLRVHVIEHDRTVGAKRGRVGRRCVGGVDGVAASPCGQGQQGPSPTCAGWTSRFQGLKIHFALPGTWRCSPGPSWADGQARS